jgi:hypothetical protein
MIEAYIRKVLVIENDGRGYEEFEIGDDITIETANGDIICGELDSFNSKSFKIVDEEGDIWEYEYWKVDDFYR